MRFSLSAFTVALVMACPHVATAFSSPMASPVAFLNKRMSTSTMPLSWTKMASCSCDACVMRSSSHTSKTCTCDACVMRKSSTQLSMSSEVAEDTVPEEVVALDGVLDGTEAHNLDRPARDSGLAKHKKDNKKDKIPIADLENGTMLTGRVKTITSYGAFLDVGYQVDALLHVSRMSDTFTSNPEEVVKVGEEYQVRVINVDKEKNQIAVTMRSEESESKPPQQRGGGQQQRSGGGGGRSPSGGGARDGYVLKLAETGFDASAFMEGEVVNTLDWGAFVKLNLSPLLGEKQEEGQAPKDMFAEGLVHISSMGSGRVDSVSSVLKVGDKIQVRIKAVEGTKLSLSMVVEEDENQRPQRSSNKGGERGPNSAPWSMKASKASTEEMQATLLVLQETMPKFRNLAIVGKARK